MTGTPGFADLIGDGGVILEAGFGSKDDLLTGLAAAGAAATGQPAAQILERLRIRETLGSTGFGQGAAIPHARLDGLPHVFVVVARLAQGVDFGALDDQPVDIAVLLLSPEQAGADHLKALARISRVLRDPASLALIRAARTKADLLAAIGPPPLGQRAA